MHLKALTHPLPSIPDPCKIFTYNFSLIEPKVYPPQGAIIKLSISTVHAQCWHTFALYMQDE